MPDARGVPATSVRGLAGGRFRSMASLSFPLPSLLVASFWVGFSDVYRSLRKLSSLSPSVVQYGKHRAVRMPLRGTIVELVT